MVIRLVLPLIAALLTLGMWAQGTTTSAPDTTNALPEPLIVVEELPEYPGGQQAMMTYIANAIDYPEEAIEKNVEGVVYIHFVVERDGTIGDVTVFRGIGGGCDQEAMRVVRSMPSWQPGRQDGEVVRTKFNLPIRFKLDQE